MTHARLVALLLAAAVGGCAPVRSTGTPSTPRDMTLLTQREIREAHYTNLYDAISALRTNWVRTQAPISFSDPSAGQVRVFMENVLLGNVTQLRHFHVSGVRSVQFLNPTEATARFGLRASGGPAIVITPDSGR